MGCSLVLIRVFILAFCISTVKPKDDIDYPKSQTCELDLAQLLLLPSDSIQVQALKQDLFRYLQEKLEENEFGKFSVSPIVRNGNIAAISGEYANEEKRSIANLAKNGQLPTFQRHEGNSDKRSIESLARNGELHSKRELDSFLSKLNEKRNLASLARGYNLPSGKRYIDSEDQEFDKRNIASIVRNSGKKNIVYDNDEPIYPDRSYIYDDFKRNLASVARQMGSRYVGKRNVAALLRQDSYLNTDKLNDDMEQSKSGDMMSDNETEKRNIASLKAQMKTSRKFKRDKRQADYTWNNDEYPMPVYQNNNVYDYEELIRALTGQYPNTEKRFLGSVARSGWFKPVTNNQYEGSTITKRHIGALAKLGWLPALRSARRFNRSGRSTRDIPVEDFSRTDSTDGQTENNTKIEDTSLNSAKRYLLIPALDNILLRKLYYNSLSSNPESP